ncbi:MAG: hypothetical protein AWU59_1253 [Methanolobus sp. T82-4]|jgi:hypothetical protein|nr:MAG: hypothetical protein AWU59_1253 [Methanolobus sp. T82-4]
MTGAYLDKEGLVISDPEAIEKLDKILSGNVEHTGTVPPTGFIKSPAEVEAYLERVKNRKR